MRAQEAIVTTNFIVSRLNLVGITQPTDLEKQVFASEATIDVVANPMHKAADRQYLTMNDKVFAARYGIVNLTPVAAVALSEEPDLDEEPAGEDAPEEKDTVTYDAPEKSGE